MRYIISALFLAHSAIAVLDSPRQQIDVGSKDMMCGLYRCGGDRLKQPCSCDDLCITYGDCCPDHPTLFTSHKFKGKNDPRIECVGTVFGGRYLMVDQCPLDWEDTYVRDMCETPFPGALLSYLLPVTSIVSDVAFKNLFCGSCNGLGLDEMVGWSYKVGCHSGVELRADNLIEKMYNRQCTLEYNEPSRRFCTTSNDRCDDRESWCHLYTDFVFVGVNGYVSEHKNIDCFKCKMGGVQATDIQCAQPTPFKVLSDLMRFSATPLVDVGLQIMLEKPVVCHDYSNATFYKGICRMGICPHGYKMRMSNRECRPMNRYRLFLCLNTNDIKTFMRSFKNDHRSQVYKYDIYIDWNIKDSSQCINATFENLYQKQTLFDVMELVIAEMSDILVGFQVTTDIYPGFSLFPRPLIENCKIRTAVVQSVNDGTISEMLSEELSSQKWSYYVDFTYRDDNVTIETCDLAETACLLVTFAKDKVKTVDIEIGEKLKQFSFSRTDVGMCIDNFTDITEAKRRERNRGLSRFIRREISGKGVGDGGTGGRLVIVVAVMLVLYRQQ